MTRTEVLPAKQTGGSASGGKLRSSGRLNLMLIKVFFILLTHLVFLVAYPHTGPMGPHYLWISALLWCGFLLFLSANVFFAKMAGALFGDLVIIAFFTALILSLVSTMPQKDKVSVLSKLEKGIYPTRDSLYYGLLRVGVQYDALLKTNSNDFDARVKRTIKEMKP